MGGGVIVNNVKSTARVKMSHFAQLTKSFCNGRGSPGNKHVTQKKSQLCVFKFVLRPPCFAGRRGVLLGPSTRVLIRSFLLWCRTSA
eukprot:9304-Rhodomonas_salina.1